MIPATGFANELLLNRERVRCDTSTKVALLKITSTQIPRLNGERTAHSSESSLVLAGFPNYEPLFAVNLISYELAWSWLDSRWFESTEQRSFFALRHILTFIRFLRETDAPPHAPALVTCHPTRMSVTSRSPLRSCLDGRNVFNVVLSFGAVSKSLLSAKTQHDVRINKCIC